MKQLLLVVLSVLININLIPAQSVISVPAGRNYLYQALDYALDGDVIELTESGNYLLDSLLLINKSLTFRAAKGLQSRPLIKNINPNLTTRFLFEIQTGGNLVLDGLELNGISGSTTPAKYLIKTAEAVDSPYKLIVNNCVLRDVNTGDENGNFFRAYANTFADTVRFTNCILYNSGREGIRIKDSENSVKYFEISNSTLFDTAHEGIYVQGDKVQFRINHCTFDNLGYLHHDMIRPRYITDVIIKNSIFSNVPEPQTRAMLLYGAAVLDYCDFFNVGAIEIHDQSAIQVGDNILYEVDPQYRNRAWRDFSLADTSPLVSYAEDGGVLGDPNAEQNRPYIPNIIFVGNTRNALYDSLQKAEDGDILELTDAATYLLDSLLIIDKNVTIRSAENLPSLPVLKNVSENADRRAIFEMRTGGGLSLAGLELDGMAGTEKPAIHLIRTAETTDKSYKLKVEDCLLHDVQENFFYASAATYADSISFNNCYLYGAGKEGIVLNEAENLVNYFGFTNSTLYNTGLEGIYVVGDQVTFRVNHCTFDSLGLDKTQMIRPAYIDNAEVKNSIFSNTPQPFTTSILFYGASKLLYSNFYNVGSISASDPAAFNYGPNVTFGVNPKYKNQPTGDFSLLPESEMYRAADDGTALGDPRWAVGSGAAANRVIPVASIQNGLYAALISAADGDTLELTEATIYKLDSLLNIDKSITIRAAKNLTSRPVLQQLNPTASTRYLFEIRTGGNLTLEGLDLDGMAGTSTTANYLIRTDEEVSGLYTLKVRNCILHDVVPNNTSGNFFRAYSKAFADTVLFDNCVMYNSGKEGIRIKDADNTVNYFQISNCTMYDTNTEAIYIQGSDVVFRVNHCTFNNCGKFGAESVRPRYILDAEIKNTIFANTPEPHNRLILLYGASVLDYCNFYNVGPVVVHDSSAHVPGTHNLFDVDPRFEEPALYNFTLLEDSPLYKKGDDGDAIGDLRWATREPATQIGNTDITHRQFSLQQNYPNPFNPTTTIPFSLASTGKTVITLFNIRGQMVKTILNKAMSAGRHRIKTDLSHMASGVYLYTIEAGRFRSTRKMILIK